MRDKKLQEKRLLICSDCEHLWKRRICKKCGCVVKMKTKIEMSKCPIGKW